MSTNWNTQEAYESFEDEIFEGEMRKLDELIGQLEFWSDIKTINHKMEQERLEEYVEMDENLYSLKNKLLSFINEQVEVERDRSEEYQILINNKFERYKETEETIHNWIKAISSLSSIIMKSQVLISHKERLESIVEA